MESLTAEQKLEVSRLMNIICDSFPLPQSTKPRSLVAAYLMALEGFEFEAIAPVLKNVITGRQVGFDGRWAPTSAQIGDWVLSRSNALKPSAVSDDGFELVSYPIGGKPPPGYMALGEYNDRRNRLAIEARERSPKVVPLPNMKADRK